MATKDNNQQLISAAQRRAFEAYLRFGHRSEQDTLTSHEAKALDYDIKTGQRGFDPKKLLEHAKRLALKYPGMTVFIMEVRPQL
jgi:hypothetical protein